MTNAHRRGGTELKPMIMNIPPDPRGATLRGIDMELLAELSVRRHVDPSAERRRVEDVRALLHRASELNRALSLFIKHSLVSCQGTPGCADLDADGSTLTAAIAAYSREVDHVRARQAEAVDRLEGECCDVKPASSPREARVRRSAPSARLQSQPENARAR
jgi:hypothetical protein